MEYTNYSKSNVLQQTFIFYGSLLVLLMATGMMVFLNNTINVKIVFGTLIIFTIYLLLINVGTDLSIKNFSDVNVENHSELDDILNLYENINDNEDITFLVIDPEDGEIVNANKGTEVFYGCSRNELLSLRMTDLNPISKEVEVYSGPVSIGSKELVYTFILESSMKRKLTN